jgi:hypothetical protein
MKEGIKLKYFYFFVMLSVAGEPVTNAMRFKYFLADVWADAKTDRYEIEEKAQKKITKITAILSQEHDVPYGVTHVDKITNTAYNVLKKYFPHYNEYAHPIDTAETSDDNDEEED